MIEENAIVVAIEGEYALVQTQRRSACQSCSVKQGCGTSVLSKVVGQRSSQIRVSNSLDAHIGDEVLLGIKENALVQGSLLVYALPLVSMLLFAVLGELWAKSRGLDNEVVIIIFAVIGFMLSMLLIRIGFTGSHLKKQIQPQMLRIIRSADNQRDTMLAP